MKWQIKLLDIFKSVNLSFGQAEQLNFALKYLNLMLSEERWFLNFFFINCDKIKFEVFITIFTWKQLELWTLIKLGSVDMKS